MGKRDDERKKDRKKKEREGEDEPALTRTQKIFAASVVLVLILSTISRASLEKERTAQTQAPAGATSDLATGFVSGERTAESAPVEEPGALESMLPYVTEASFFALMGFAVGYATRKVVKVLLLFLALFFVIVQLLSYNDMASVEWGGVIETLNGWIFNLKEDQTLTQVLTDRVPSSGSFLLGVVLGFKRG